MSCSHAALSTRSASSPRIGANGRTWRATPWTCAHRRGNDDANSVRAISRAQPACPMPRREARTRGRPRTCGRRLGTSAHKTSRPQLLRRRLRRTRRAGRRRAGAARRVRVLVLVFVGLDGVGGELAPVKVSAHGGQRCSGSIAVRTVMVNVPRSSLSWRMLPPLRSGANSTEIPSTAWSRTSGWAARHRITVTYSRICSSSSARRRSAAWERVSIWASSKCAPSSRVDCRGPDAVGDVGRPCGSGRGFVCGGNAGCHVRGWPPCFRSRRAGRR
jgi:hypothetical protein